ncbi:hypothetical protein F2Q69_00024734 [Brassica cretica]|uniref:Uncharacterized protein n=1 Tax=Brassica cretica TaxID=69181 RepID=A0A8S9QMI9_BRACR|nr:hypothetical protein F2Q69_00024734 [Brassica cretica]
MFLEMCPGAVFKRWKVSLTSFRCPSMAPLESGRMVYAASRHHLKYWLLSQRGLAVPMAKILAGPSALCAFLISSKDLDNAPITIVMIILIGFLQDSGLNDTSMTHLTWGLVNDTYRMDLILTHPPYLITLACIYIAFVYKEKYIRTWFEELSVDMNIVKNIGIEILDIYENHRMFTEERVHAAFNKLATSP